MDQIVNIASSGDSVIRLHPNDNVAVARVPLSGGQTLRVGGLSIEVREPVPFGHKVALADLAAGAAVIRFGQDIGHTTVAVARGQHIHDHNTTVAGGGTDYVFPESGVEAPEPTSAATFLGYPREDGRAGTRNYIAVVAASNCAAYAAELTARAFPRESLPENVDGVAAFPHWQGCSMQRGPDTDQLQRTISGVLDHPNVAGAVIVGLGCELNQIDLYLGPDSPNRDRLVGLTLQETGGTRAAAAAASREVKKMIERAAGEKRVEVPASKLTLGLQCGGSDAFSGVSSNPALGNCCDRLVAAGGTAVLGETTETFGAEQLLVGRSRNREVAERYLALVEQYKDYLRLFGATFIDNPSPGNKSGGITNILEKSLGAVAKGGTTPVMAAYDYAERIDRHGLVFMNTPGNDPASLAGIAAGGANVIAFTTGRGSATGFPSIPVVKISSNSSTYNRMPEDMDVNAGRITDGEATIEEIGAEIFDFVLRVASGETTCSEKLGHNEFVPWSIGPLL